MSTLKEIATKISGSSRLKKALFSEDATDTDLLSIFVDFGLVIYEATKEKCVRAYGSHRYMNSMDIKKFIRDAEFPDNLTMQIK